MKQNFEPRPYKLYNKIKHYLWGGKDNNAFIPKLLGINVEAGVPYAELWIGAHPKAPSEIIIDGDKISLDKIIEKFPVECLGNYVSNKFSNKFPFLLKVLSAESALSIQTHPNRGQAEKLHRTDPLNYPDDNHKPEIAIALDSLTAVAGFKPADEIISNLKSYPEITEFSGISLTEKQLIDSNKEVKENLIQEIYSSMMKKNNDAEELADCIARISERLKTKTSLSPEESLFKNQVELYENDIGLLSFFFFNFIQLAPGQAIFTGAGTPHAYIRGNIVECMANSDNVVRAGLTNKFKDVEALLEILKYDFSEYSIINKEQKIDEVVYKTGAEEFEISAFKKQGEFIKDFVSDDKPSVCLITEGVLEVSWEAGNEKKSEQFKKGQAFFVPASLKKYTFNSGSHVKYFIVNIP